MCKAIGNCRVTVSYMATRTGDAALGQRIEGDRPGAPSLRLATPACSAQGEGYPVNHKKLFRLYREIGRKLE